MTASKVLFLLCLVFAVGIFAESVLNIPQYLIWGFLVLGTILILLALGNKLFIRWQAPLLFLREQVDRGTPRVFQKVYCLAKKFAASLLVLGFCVFLFVLGVLRTQIAEFGVADDKLAQLNGKGEVTLIGLVADEPVLKDKSQQIKIKTGDDIVLVTTDKYPEYNYLDKVKITGKLEAPMETEDFSYKNYLMKDGIYSVMAFPKIELIGGEKMGPLSFIYSKILFLKQNLRQSINKIFPSPESLVLQGLILGDRAAMPKEIKREFNVTGTSHIIAVSGTHIVILGSILMSFLLAIGIWRQRAFYLSIAFICFYIVLVGMPSSGVRSAIMAIVFLAGQNLGRQSTSSRILVLAGALMLMQNPLLLTYDIGFQLSFLAVLGLIYLEPLIRHLIKLPISDDLIMMFSATISAQVFTLPIIVYNFGNFSFVSPIVNMLILPVVYYIMLFGFLSVIFGSIFFALGWIISLPCHFLMQYFLFVVKIFSGTWAYKVIENIHWVWLLIGYIIISCFVWDLNRRFKKNIV